MSRLLACLQIALIATGLAFAGAVPRPAPPLSVITTKGETMSLDSLRGKVVVVEFFLTTCPHCQNSTGVLMPIYKEWKPRGLEVIAIAIDANIAPKTPGQPTVAQRVDDFVRQFGVTYPTSFGSRDTVVSFTGMSPKARFYVPYMLFVDRAGKIRFEHSGQDSAFYDKEDVNMRNELDALLKEPVPPRKVSVNKAAARPARKPAPKS